MSELEFEIPDKKQARARLVNLKNTLNEEYEKYSQRHGLKVEKFYQTAYLYNLQNLNDYLNNLDQDPAYSLNQGDIMTCEDIIQDFINSLK